MSAILLREQNFKTEVLNEEVEGKKFWYIKGPFLQAEVVNRNRRFYPKPIMESAVGSYIKELVETRGAMGELTHPETPELNPYKICHIVESITQDGNNYIGRAKILNTPTGQIVQGLLEGGARIGVSSRGMGSVVDNGKGINEVQKDFKIAAIDAVLSPSAPDAYVQGLMEGAAYIYESTIEEDREFIDDLKREFKRIKKADLKEGTVRAFNKFMRLIAESNRNAK